MSQILILNGPAGVGKTTVADKLAARVDGAVCVKGDQLRSFAPSDPQPWLGSGSTYRAAGVLASFYVELGAPLVIFEYVFERAAQVDLFLAGLPSGVPVHLVTLWAPFEVVLSREAKRTDKRSLGPRVEECYQALEGSLKELGLVVDTADSRPDQVVDAVVGHLGARL